MTQHRLTARERVQVVSALRYWGRAAMSATIHPSKHPTVAGRFQDHLPMTLDEIETLIGRLDGSWTAKGLRTWEPYRNL